MLSLKKILFIFFAAAQLHLSLAEKMEFKKWNKADEITPFVACKVATSKAAMYCKKDTTRNFACQCSDVVAFGAMSYCAIENKVDLHDYVHFYKQRCALLNITKFNITKEFVHKSYNNVTKFIKNATAIPKFNVSSDVLRTPIAYNQKTYNLSYKAYYTNVQNQSWGIIFGLIFLGFWLFNFVMLGIYQVLFKLWRPRFLVTAEFKSKKVIFIVFSKVYNILDYFHIPIDPNEFNFSKTFGIVGTVIIIMVGSCWNYHTMDKNYLFPIKSVQIAKYIADRTGFLAMFPLNLSILLASRNNFLLWCTGWNLADMIFFHKFFALIAVVLASAHGIAYWIYSVKVHVYTARYKKHYWIAGVYTIIVGAAMVFLSNHRIVRKHYYEVFLVVHITLAVVFVYGVWNHLSPLDYIQYIIPYIGVWSLERLTRFINMFVVFGGYRKNTAVLYEDETSEDKNDIFIKLKIDNYNKSLFKIKEGSFGFVYLGLPLFFWQAHPFTFVKLPNSDEFSIVMKVKKGISMKLYKKFKKMGTKTMDLRVCIEGPYGLSNRNFVNKHDQLSVVTTGTAAAGPISYLSNHRASKTHDGSLKPNVMHWGVRSLNIVRAFEDEIRTMIEKDGLNMKVNIYCRKLDISESLSGKDSSNSSNQSTSEKSLTSFSSNVEYFAHYMNAAECVNESFENHESLVIMTCGLMSISYQVKKQYMENIINDKSKQHVGFIDESQSW